MEKLDGNYKAPEKAQDSVREQMVGHRHIHPTHMRSRLDEVFEAGLKEVRCSNKKKGSRLLVLFFFLW